MANQLSKIVVLFQKSLWDKLSLQEKEELDRLLQDEELRKVYHTVQQSGVIGERLEEYQQYSAQEAFRKFKTLHRKKKNRIFYISVAAAVVMILIEITILLNNATVRMDIPSLTDNEQIAPGKHKAILRLADGQVIDMVGDTMQIQEKAGTKIKYSQGAIAYSVTGQVEELIFNELIVPLAGECYITLDDGSRVWVNSGSRLKYPVKFIGEERKVFLEGEAYFEVVKDGKPFIVNTALGEINVLGTHFDVKAYKEDGKVYTTLVSGKVSFAGREIIELAPGEQVIAFASGKMEKQVVDVEEYVGWKEGLYIFKNQDLETIMEDLCRWYDVSVFFQNPALKQLEFTGNLKRYDNINIFMELLQRTGDVKYRISGKTIIIFR